jgi:hypothetical protein
MITPNFLMNRLRISIGNLLVLNAQILSCNTKVCRLRIKVPDELIGKAEAIASDTEKKERR